MENNAPQLKETAAYYTRPLSHPYRNTTQSGAPIPNITLTYIQAAWFVTNWYHVTLPVCRKWSIILSGLVPSKPCRKVIATLHAVQDSTGSNPNRQPQAYRWLPPDGEEDTPDRLPKSNAASCADRGLSLHNSSHQKGLEQLARQHMTADSPDTFVSRVPKQNPNTASSCETRLHGAK